MSMVARGYLEGRVLPAGHTSPAMGA
jgi:hypothetical protein